MQIAAAWCTRLVFRLNLNVSFPLKLKRQSSMLIERSAQKQFLISTAESVKTELQYVKNAMSTTFNRTESSNFKIQI